MKKTITSTKRPLALLAGLSLLCGILSACDKMPMNGDLDGMWQLMGEERDSAAADLQATRHYISFQLHTAQFSTATNSRCFYAHFRHTADSLQFLSICANSTNASDSDDNTPVPPDSIASLRPWGIYELNPSFAVVKLNSTSLVLQSTHSRLHFRKF